MTEKSPQQTKQDFLRGTTRGLCPYCGNVENSYPCQQSHP
jgi:hypothetical protein